MARNFFLPLILASACLVQSDEIDDLCKKDMESNKIPGMAIGVSKNGKLIDFRTYGVANLESQAAINSQTMFRIASNSKQFCATAVLLLWSEGKINLDERIRTYLPKAPEEWRDVTVRSLLHHQSGIPDVTDSGRWRLTREYTMDDFFGLFKSVPMASPVNSKFAYNNFGYATLGLLVEAVSGMTLEKFVDARIFKPLGMTRTAYYSPEQKYENKASGYLLREGKHVPASEARPMIFAGSGGILSCVDDLIKWDNALKTEFPLNQSMKSVAWIAGTLLDGKRSNYGMGWFVGKRNQRDTLSHTGSTPGFTSMTCRYLKEDLTLIVLRNGGATTVREVCDGIASVLLRKLDKRGVKNKNY